MRRFLVLVPALLLACQASGANLSDTHFALPQDTPGLQELLEARFPPRVYSFDPRPKINPADLIYNHDVPRPESEATSNTSQVQQHLDKASDAPYSVNTSASVTPQVEEFDHERDTEPGEMPSSLIVREKLQAHNASRESIETVVTDLPDVVVPMSYGEDGEERPRAIVDVSREGLSGEVSYIIHPDNQPPPTYVPLKDLPPLAHPAAQWRPDIFMKVCCSSPPSTTLPADPVASASLEVKSGYAQVGTSVPDEGEPTEDTPEVGYEGIETAHEIDDEIAPDGDDPADANSEADWVTTTVPEVSDDASTQRSSRNSTEIALSNGTDASGNHTPRYEESGSTTYQDVANFLKDIANSDGFKNAFLGDLINNFGNLDQNAMKLIYSLLIRPLEGVQGASGKEDNVRTVPEPRPAPPTSMPAGPHGSMVLERKRLRLRDPPVNNFEPFRSIFPPSRSSGSQRTSIRPSYPVRQVHYTANSEDAWHPSRTAARLPAHGRRGDESVDVITAPPFQTFEVVLGSSINHDDKNAGSSIQIQHNGPPLPFDKLTLGLEMPPPDALDALPPGSVLIPPSYILGRPKLPLIHNKKNGAPSIEMPLSDFLPNLPFFGNKSPRFHPPAKPQAQDIPPRLPSFLSSLLPNAPPPRPVRPPGPMISPQRASSSLGLADSRPGFHGMARPTGPPPPITKLTPPGQRVPPSVSTAPVPQQVFEQDGPGSSMARPGSTFGPVSPTVFGALHHLPQHAPDTVWAPPINEAPEQEGMVHIGDQEYHASLQTPLKDVHDEEEIGSSGGAMNEPEGRIPDRNVDNHPQNGAFIPDNAQNDQQRPPESVNYHDLPPEYVNYYDLDYRDYYHDQNRGSNGGGVLIEENLDAMGQASHQDAVAPPITMSPPQPPSLGIHLHEGEGHHIDSENLPESHFPSSHSGHLPSLDDLLGVRKPEAQPPTLTEQEKNELQMLLQNHQMANILAEGNGTVVDLLSAHNNDSMEDILPANVHDTPSTPATFQGEITTTDNGHYPVPLTGHRGGSQASLPPLEHDTVFSEHDASIAHLWKNIQLIPLVPELFESPNHDSEDAMNLTSLFDGAVPLSPGSIHETMPDNSDLERIVIDSTDGHVTVPEEVVEDTEKANAKFMAYVLIGACCGLALLSIAGVIVIVRFKKTCGSRQIKTRTRLTEQDSIENISRRVENLALGGESGHKLGSWFTGRNEHIGSGKLRGNMALPEVQDLKREKSSKSGSARDLLSICSESSRSSSPRQARHDGEGTARTDDEEPRSSWLHDEYRGSVSDLSQATGQDPAYSSQQYQQSHSSPHASTAKPHPADHQRYHPESSVEAELVERSVRERRYTGHSRAETDKLQRSASRRGPRYLSSIDSEELEERLVDRDQHYITDSELDDGMTHYDDDESREPSRYFSDSRELDDVVTSRSVDPSMMTSQELGEHLSRDLKHYQSRKMATTHQQQQQGDGRDTACLPESSQEGEGGSRELQRSQSQVSFSRDNVQNEVFLEFDNIFRQHGQFLNSEPPASTLGRISRGTDDTHLSVSRANTPDSIDLPEEYPTDSHNHDDIQPPPSSPPTTPPRFSPPPAPPRPPKPGHLSQPGTPSPQANRAHSSPSVESSAVPRSNQQRPVYWTNDEERLV